MTQTERRPGEGHRGDEDQHPCGRPGSVERIPPRPRGRAAASWGQRHLRRLDKIFSGRDPWTGEQPSDVEIDVWWCAWHSLHRVGPPAIVPESVGCPRARRWPR
ncbi:MAG: hypothetical protein ACRDRU_20660 [Pseudonocardiaceae bacterium]